MKPDYEQHEEYYQSLFKFREHLERDPEVRTLVAEARMGIKMTDPESYELYQNSPYYLMMMDQPEWNKMPERSKITTSLLICQVEAYLKNNKPTFYFDPELLSKLNDTDITGIYLHNIFLPFPTMYMHLEGLSVESIGVPLTGVYITRCTPLVYQLTFTTHYTVMAMCTTLRLGEKNDELVMEIETVGDVINADLFDSVKTVLNCLMYININDFRKSFVKGRDLSKIKNRAKLRKAKQGKEAYISYYHMRYIRSTSSKGEGGSDGGRGITVGFMVRGHWRNQAYGKDHADRKVIWVQPYMKGEDEDEVKDPVYKVK